MKKNKAKADQMEAGEGADVEVEENADESIKKL